MRTSFLGHDFNHRPVAEVALVEFLVSALLHLLSSLSIGFAPILVLFSATENLVFFRSETTEDQLCTTELDTAVVGEIATHSRELLFPNSKQCVDGAVPDLQRRQVRQEIVANKEDEKDPIVDGALEIKGERQLGDVEFDFKIFTEGGDVQKDEGLLLRWRGCDLVVLTRFLLGSTCAACGKVTGLSTEVASLGLVVGSKDIFTEHLEIRLVSGERQHDEIGIETVDDVLGIGIVLGMGTLTADVLHDLVLSFTGHASIRDDDLDVLPARVRVDFLCNPVS